MKKILMLVILAGLVALSCKSTRKETTAGNAPQDTVGMSGPVLPADSQFAVARAGDLMELKRFAFHGGDVTNITDPYHSTLLHLAADGGQEEVAAWLISKGLSATAVNDDGFTPLHSCALHGDSATAELLIKNGATLYARDNNQMTPLHLCGLNNNVSVAKVLIMHGANVNDHTTTNWTPLRVAQYGKANEMITLLREHGATE